MSKNTKLPEKVDPYWTVGGSREPEDFTAIALFETPNGERDAVIGFTLKNIPEVSGFVSFIAEKFGSENRYKVAMLELPMIYWSNGTQGCLKVCRYRPWPGFQPQVWSADLFPLHGQIPLQRR